VFDGEVSRAWCAFVEGLVGSQSIVGVAEQVDCDGDALAVEVHRFRHLYNTIRPHQALADRTPAQVYTAPGGGPGLVSA